MGESVPTPIHDAIDQNDGLTILNFIEWLSENGYHICRAEDVRRDHTGVLPAGHYPVYKSPAQWIVESLGFDYKDWLAESDALLEYLRETLK